MRLRHLRRLLSRCALDVRCLSRVLLPALAGLCMGMTLSMMYAPFSDDSCETFMAKQDPQKMIKLRDTRSVDVEDDMYEPRQLDPESLEQAAYKLDVKAGSKFYRPKFAATELGIRQKLFVAVLSSKETLNSHATAVNRTLSRHVTKTVFFVEQKSSYIPTGMIIVNFEDGYNNLLPINVLKYVIKKYGLDYDYYMFISDKGYVRAEKLFDLVSLVSVSRHVHLGAPKAVEGGKTYCALDGGVIVSQSILSQVNSSLKWCSDNCHHSDQSLNFGKCLLHTSDMDCQNTVANKVYTAYPVKDFNFNKDIEALREQLDFNKSLSIFPIPDDINHYKIHRYFCEVELNSTRHEIQEMKDKMLYISQFAPNGRDSITWPVGVPEPYKCKNRFDVIRWEYFTETHLFFQDDFTNVKELVGSDKLDIQDIIKVSMEKLNEKHNNKYLYSHLINGYRRFDPQRGMEYMLDLALEDTSVPRDGNNENINNVVEKRVFLVRPLGEVEIVTLPYVTESTLVNIILPIRVQDIDGCGVFLENFVRLQADAGDNLALVVVLIYYQLPENDKNDTFFVIKSMVNFYNSKQVNGVKITMLNLTINEPYIPEYKTMDLVSSHLNDNSLILMGTVGMLINTEMLNRVRINTISGWQVFFPIGFWQFKPNLIYESKPYPTVIEMSNKIGHYDVLSYEHGSFYNVDYKMARRLMTEAQVSQYDVYEMFVKFGQLHVFRAVEPEFKHFYMHLECVQASPAVLYERCLERRSQNLGTRSQLAKLIFKYQNNKNNLQESDEGTTTKKSANEDTYQEHNHQENKIKEKK